LATAVVPPALAAPAATASPATHGRLTLARLRFVPPTVNARSGTAKVALTWNLKDSNRRATAISGYLDIRLQGHRPGSYVGQVVHVAYSLGAGPYVVWSTGTAQDSFYSYTFAVPGFSFARTARWVVTRFTASDDQGNTLALYGTRLGAYRNVLTATEKVDSAPPGYNSLALGAFVFPPPHPYVYDGGPKGGSMTYSLTVTDPKSGFWKGRLTLRGPGGRTLAARFAQESAPSGPTCGTLSSYDDTNAMCSVTVTFPHGTASGTWRVWQITLWDNAGNKAVYKNLSALPVIVTADDVMSASAFQAIPNPVNNWTSGQNVQISMRISGATRGARAIYVDFAQGSNCEPELPTPTAHSDGTTTVPIFMFQQLPFIGPCQVTGIAIVDHGGHAALYGPEYGAPDPGLKISTVPDTPPVATGASLSPATLSASSLPAFTDLHVTVNDAVAPVNEVSATILDSKGNPVGGALGGVPDTLTGTVVLSVEIGSGSLAPGTYTVAFQITDIGGLTSSYGYPTSPPVPGGPITLTITP
jgi:hypothetical protein